MVSSIIFLTDGAKESITMSHIWATRARGFVWNHTVPAFISLETKSEFLLIPTF